MRPAKTFKHNPSSPRLKRMRKEETLQRIKEVESQVRTSKDEALAERERILRTARRETLELRDALRGDAEKRQEAILRDADVQTARERERMLTEGRKDAMALRARADANMDRAVERLIEKFKGAVNA